MTSAQQLPLDLSYRPAFGREDFLVSPCNRTAVGMLDDWHNWPQGVLVIYGPRGSGKTHLAHVWQESCGARMLAAETLRVETIDTALKDVSALIVDDAEHVGEARALLHLYNLCREQGVHLLLTARRAPAHWGLELKDLSSRLKAAPAVALDDPDEELLAAVMMKQFADRQLQVGGDVLAYVLPRLERSFEAVAGFVRRLDETSLADRRRITVPLAGRVLREIED